MIFCVSHTDKPGKPKAPLDIVDVYCDRCALLWDKPDDDGGCPITHYVVEMKETGGDWKKVCLSMIGYQLIHLMIFCTVCNIVMRQPFTRQQIFGLVVLF